MCVLFSVCVIHARQDSPGEGRAGVWGEQLQPSPALIGDFHRFLAGLQQYSSSLNLAGFTHCFCACFYFWLWLSSPLQLFQVPQEEAHSCPSSGAAQETVAPGTTSPTSTSDAGFTPGSSPGQTDSPRLW